MTIFLKPTLEIKTRLENLMESCDYEIMELKTKRLAFNTWNDKIYFDAKNLRKGIIELSESTILTDPESVIITDKAKIELLSKELDCKITASIQTCWALISTETL